MCQYYNLRVYTYILSAFAISVIWRPIKVQDPIMYIPHILKKQKVRSLTLSNPYSIYPYVKAWSLPTEKQRMSPQSLKNGDRYIPGDYRPIRLTSVVGKMLESIIGNKVVSYLGRHSVIRGSQHEFRKKKDHVCQTCWRSIMTSSEHDITRSLDIVFLDFQ